MGIHQQAKEHHMHQKRQQHTNKHSSRFSGTKQCTTRSFGSKCGCCCSEHCSELVDGRILKVPNVFADTSISNRGVHVSNSLHNTHDALRPYAPFCAHTARRALHRLRERHQQMVPWQHEHIEYFERMLARHSALVQQALQRLRMQAQVGNH